MLHNRAPSSITIRPRVGHSDSLLEQPTQRDQLTRELVTPSTTPNREMGKQQPKRSVHEPLSQLTKAPRQTMTDTLAGQQRQQLLPAQLRARLHRGPARSFGESIRRRSEEHTSE